MPAGTLVIILEASIVTNMLGDAEGTGSYTVAGALNVFGVQVSRKNPMVFSTAGSVGGWFTGGFGGGGVTPPPPVDFLQAG